MSITLKSLALQVALAAWIALAPARASMAAVFLLPIADLCLGVVCSVRAKRPITSSGIKRTVGKVFLYEIAALLAFVVETYLAGPILPAVKMVTGLIGVTELKSCLEHLDELNGSPLFAAILERIVPPND